MHRIYSKSFRKSWQSWQNRLVEVYWDKVNTIFGCFMIAQSRYKCSIKKHRHVALEPNQLSTSLHHSLFQQNSYMYTQTHIHICILSTQTYRTRTNTHTQTFTDNSEVDKSSENKPKEIQSIFKALVEEVYSMDFWFQ